jgi:hypothetical protein
MKYQANLMPPVWQASQLLQSKQPDVAETVCDFVAAMLHPDMVTNLWSIPHCSHDVRNVLAELGRHFMMGALSDQERDYLVSSLNGYLRSRGHTDWFATQGDGVH